MSTFTWSSVRTAEVRVLRPDYTALLIIADGLQPGPSDAASEAILAAAEQRAAKHLASAQPEDLPQVAQWREAFPGLAAADPAQRRGPAVPPGHGPARIDRITHIYKAISVAFLLLAGGEDMARYAGPARLIRAGGGEDFDIFAAGQPVIEHPEPVR